MPAPALLNMFAAHAAAAPASLTPGYTAYYDASDSATVHLSGSNISQLDDQSGNGYHLGAGGSVDSTQTINGLSVATFNGTQYLYNGSIAPAATSTFYCVIRASSATPSWATAIGFDSATICIGSNSSNQWVGSGINTSIAVDTSAHVMCIVYNGASSVLSIDGTETTGTASASGFDRIQWGRQGNGSTVWNGDVAMMVLYNGSAHDLATRTANKNVLKAKWATP